MLLSSGTHILLVSGNGEREYASSVRLGRPPKPIDFINGTLGIRLMVPRKEASRTTEPEGYGS